MDSKKNILVIDDDESTVSLIEFWLVRSKFSITWLRDGKAALAAIEHAPSADLVILDVMMPFCDGYEIIERMRASALWRHIPVIFLTGMAREQDLLLGFEKGATDYLTKPFRPAELLARIHAILAREK